MLHQPTTINIFREEIGFNPVDCGGLRNARLLEGMGISIDS